MCMSYQMTKLVMHIDYSEKLLYLSTYFAGKEIRDILQSYTKFMVVRHPIERLVSAYWHLLVLGHFVSPEYIKIRENIVKAIHPQTERTKLGTLQPLFQDFVAMRLDPKWEFYKEKHWIPYSSLCNPCRVKYDYIFKLETLQHELIPILQRISSKNTSVEHLKDYVVKKNRSKKYGAIYDNLKHKIKSDDAVDGKPEESHVVPEMFNLTLSQRIKLYNLYKIDSELFDYTFDVETGKVGYGESGECEWKN